MMVTCKERDGVYIRRVEWLRRDLRNLVSLRERLRTVRNCFGDRLDTALADPEVHILTVDDVGILSVESISTVQIGGLVHVTFWDGRLRGREYLARRGAEFVMEHFNLKFVYTNVPHELKAVAAFCLRCGFEEQEPYEEYRMFGLLRPGVPHSVFGEV